MNVLLNKATRFLFFTGKGGVGKTSMSCAVAVGLAQAGKKVLLISTDPASNLHEVLETDLGSQPVPVNGVPGLDAMNINPMVAAEEYRERMVGPYRGVLPDDAVQQMEEQLSGACTVEIAGFNEFSKMIGDETLIGGYDHVVLDTAPTGHTLRLLNLPSAWNEFIAGNETGSSCLGPVAGLADQKALYEQVVNALKNPEQTLLVLVARAEPMSLAEAARASIELAELGLTNQHLILNGVFSNETSDKMGRDFAAKSAKALSAMPEIFQSLEQTEVPFRPHGVMGVDALKAVAAGEADPAWLDAPDTLLEKLPTALENVSEWEALFQSLEKQGCGVVMTMGKGGVGKTVMASTIAAELARRGHSVLLSTTDPAAHVAETIGADSGNLQVSRIDPKAETEAYCEGILEKNRGKLSEDDLALLEEELRSPCIEEIAVFQAFAQTVAKGTDQFIVLDTAPTGHTLLLLDSTEAYHREVAKSADDIPAEVKELLPHIRDPEFTKILIVALPEATPTHEAADLQRDLRRAGIEPFGWIINRSFAVSGTSDPVLCAKGLHETEYIAEIAGGLSAKQTVISPWVGAELSGVDNLQLLTEAATPDPVG
ncbi:arsenical pump-driving ATPase [Pontiella agarivorans]|uniref:arsenite-transporting ATPase n=1 Tax=Pontiella agarivorans TaxID=3038953 RepID=A0ABU5MVJ0_9BACT|nr:arsenical pump-driving ATPase [Pontiella agarivorans]MDZ8118229.1 arsenical pump-driving ATPase [Pontiella agarivorans]